MALPRRGISLADALLGVPPALYTCRLVTDAAVIKTCREEGRSLVSGALLPTEDGYNGTRGLEGVRLHNIRPSASPAPRASRIRATLELLYCHIPLDHLEDSLAVVLACAF